ncbi:TetR/AcrR family transcriptional regulator [Mycolicibacter icosiumassiliensis]|uniref:TetR/AcrR family transcriptional regulator n=1 Tax=Mycolicibacter icosiumassiliensis TaxID=1792835 RepID=UPI000829671C|nr:TetR/AcrR family transcriptional regulator [Mycolicibacter icosiumassiliensis]
MSAALALFAERGFAATSVRQIAAAVGVTDAALYSHFASKQAIFDRLVESMGPPTPALLGMDPAVIRGAAPAVVIPAAVERLLAHWSDPEVRMFTAVLLREGGRAGAGADLADSIEVARSLLTPVFEAWQDAGHLRRDVPARQIVWELLAPLNVIRFLFLRHDADPSDLADARRMAAEHLDYFRVCAFTSPTDHLTD